MTNRIHRTTAPTALAPRTITAPGVRLRPLKDTDLPAIDEALRDHLILNWAAGRAVADTPVDERARLWLESRRTNWAHGIAQFAIADPDQDTLFGAMNLRDINRLPDQAVVGYWVTPAARGRGLASKALNAAAHWALTAPDAGGLGLHRINLDHVLLNTASCKVALKADFQIEGTMRDYFVELSGQRHDSHLHARLATDSADHLEGYCVTPA